MNADRLLGFTLLYQGKSLAHSLILSDEEYLQSIDHVGGLEVLNANGIWVPAPPKPHAYIVNTGSYMEVLSNGRFPATVHRAFGNDKCERFSLPFFFNPDPTSIISPHPKLLASGEKSRFEAQHIGQRTMKGIMTNRPEHPFLKKLKALGLKEEELDCGLVTRKFEEIVDMYSKR